MDKENLQAIKEKINLDFKGYYGIDQQNYFRTTQYNAFQFLKPEKVNLKIWEKNEKYPNTFIVNKKTKQGREIYKFLENGLQYSNFNLIFEILNIERGYKFTFPYLEIGNNDILFLYLGDNHEPQDENIIEITSKEFDELNK